MEKPRRAVLNPNVDPNPGGLLHHKDGNGTYHAKAIPGRNDPCACGSGKKAKRCHPDGLRGRAGRVDPPGPTVGPCSACGATDRATVPLKHDATPGATLARICLPCLREDPQKALQAILTRQAPRPALRPVVDAVLQARPDVAVGAGEPLTYTRYPSPQDPATGRPSIYVRCDQNHLASLGPGHKVAEDGTVKPSIGCHVDGCGWHVWGRLADWKPATSTCPCEVKHDHHRQSPPVVCCAGSDWRLPTCPAADPPAGPDREASAPPCIWCGKPLEGPSYTGDCAAACNEECYEKAWLAQPAREPGPHSQGDPS